MKKKTKEEIINEFINKVIEDDVLRREVTQKNHLWFLYIYLSHHIKYKMAPFQKKMLSTTENSDDFLSVIVAFRGSAK